MSKPLGFDPLLEQPIFHGHKLSEIADVNEDGKVSGSILKYDTTSGKWKVGVDNDTLFTAGTGLSLSGTQFSLDSSYVTNNLLKLNQSTPQTLTASPIFNNLTAGRIPFASSTKTLTDDSNLFWDNTNKRLGVGTSSPSGSIHVYSSASGSPNILFRLENAYKDVGFKQGTIEDMQIIQTYSISQGTDTGRLLLQPNGGFVGIGTTNVGARLHISSATAKSIVQIIQGGPSQTANLTEWQDSSGTVLNNVSSAGDWGWGTAANPKFKLYASKTQTDPTTQSYAGIYAIHSASPTDNSGGSYSAIVYDSRFNSTKNLTSSSGGLRGSSSIVRHAGTGTVSNAVGFFSNYISTGGGVSTYMFHFLAYKTSLTSGTVTNMYGFRAENMGGTGITNSYGVYIASQSGASSNNYAIYTHTGLVRFGDQVSIIGSADRVLQIIKGYSSQTANLTEWQNSGGTVLAFVDSSGAMSASAYKVGATNGIDKTITVLDADGSTTHALTFTKGILTACVTI